jgi:hypothetical protein
LPKFRLGRFFNETERLDPLTFSEGEEFGLFHATRLPQVAPEKFSRTAIGAATRASYLPTLLDLSTSSKF